MLGIGNRFIQIIFILFSTMFFYGGSHVEASRMEEKHQIFFTTISPNEKNLAFRDIQVSKENGKYLITGKVKAEKHSVYYTVEDGHNELVLETAVPINNISATKWSLFKIEFAIQTNKWPKNREVFLIFYEKDKDGNVFSIDQVVIPLSPNNKSS